MEFTCLANAGVAVGSGEGEEVAGWNGGEAAEELVINVGAGGAGDEEGDGADLFVDGCASIDGDEVAGVEDAVFGEAEGDCAACSHTAVADIDEARDEWEVVAVDLTQ